MLDVSCFSICWLVLSAVQRSYVEERRLSLYDHSQGPLAPKTFATVGISIRITVLTHSSKGERLVSLDSFVSSTVR